MPLNWLSRLLQRLSDRRRDSGAAKTALAAGTASLAALGTSSQATSPPPTKSEPGGNEHVVVSKYSDKFVLFRVTDDPDTVPTLEKLQAARDSLREARSELTATKDSLRTARATIKQLLSEIQNGEMPNAVGAADSTKRDTAQRSTPRPAPSHSSHGSHRSHASHSSHSSHRSHVSGGWN